MLAGGDSSSRNTGGVASYIPGTEANRQSRAEHGQDPSYGRGSQGYSSNTGGGVASYIPGTDANRQSRAEHGQDPSYGRGNQGELLQLLLGLYVLVLSP